MPAGPPPSLLALPPHHLPPAAHAMLRRSVYLLSGSGLVYAAIASEEPAEDSGRLHSPQNRQQHQHQHQQAERQQHGSHVGTPHLVMGHAGQPMGALQRLFLSGVRLGWWVAW